MDAVFTGKMITGQHLNFLVPAEDRKIFSAQKMKVVRIVPLTRQGFGNRDPAQNTDLESRPQIAEIGETDQDLPAHPQSLGEDGVRVPDFRQAVVEDNVVKTLVRIFGKTLVQVTMEDINASPQAFGDGVLVYLNTLAPDVPFFSQDT